MKRPKKKVEYVTRDMLSRLRDEIEDIMDQANAATDRAERELRQRNKFIDNFYKIEARFEAIEKSVQDMKGLMGLDHIPSHASVLNQSVTWSYFHSWISQINARIEKLERKLQ